MTVTATVGSRQGINALKNGEQIGGTTIYAGAGSPNGVYVALRIGDLYIDYTNGIQYIATATGASSWSTASGLPVGTILLSAGSAIPTTTTGADEGAPSESTTNKVMRVTMDFDQTTQQYCQWRFSMPHDYDGGTIAGKVKWGSAGAGDAIFGIQGVCIGDGEALDAAFGSAKEVTDTLIAAADLQVTAATAAITLAGTPAADILSIIQLYRKAAAGGDTLTADALVDEVVLFYTKLAI